MEAVLGLIAVLALVLLNGFFVAAEFGLVGARRTRITQLASEGNKGAISAEHALEHLDSYIAATQLGITLASLGLGWIGEPAVADLIEPLFEKFLPASVAEGLGHTISLTIAFSIVTMLHIILGELAPKSIALQRPEATSIIAARPTGMFLRLFGPVIFVMNSIGNKLISLIGFEPAGGHAQVHSVEELLLLVNSSRKAGLLEKSEETLLHRAFDFGDIPVESVMRPRLEVGAVAEDIALPDLLNVIRERRYSRYPVYAGTIDEVIGVLHTRDLFEAIIAHPQILTENNDGFDLKSLLTTPIFVPEKLPIRTLLERMQRAANHFAIVIGEYGDMTGVATMEDIVEELIGEVRDEADEERAPIEAAGDSTIVDGLVSITDITERFGDPGETILSITIGGYLAEKLGRMPQVGDKIAYGDYEVTVSEMDGLRVARLRFIKRAAKKEDS